MTLPAMSSKILHQLIILSPQYLTMSCFLPDFNKEHSHFITHIQCYMLNYLGTQCFAGTLSQKVKAFRDINSVIIDAANKSESYISV